MTISRGDDLLRRPFTTDFPTDSHNKVSKTEVWDPQREREYQREIENSRQEETDNSTPASDSSRP
ncbi:MAG: hypothetical protein QOH70_3758 [Blastocatellia bacterium]|jgi:hypothetical protein|nr:hypothetical protein [Blastocatellia bacterium]